MATYRTRAVEDRSSPCWTWAGYIKPDGYGLHTYTDETGKRTTQHAHRAVYKLLISEIPTEMQLDHLCRTPSCVNPAHMEPVTNGENVRRGLTGRGVFACGHPVTDENTVQTKTTRRCRTCLRKRDAAQKRKWRAENPEKMTEANRQYYLANAEDLRAKQRERNRRSD